MVWAKDVNRNMYRVDERGGIESNRVVKTAATIGRSSEQTMSSQRAQAAPMWRETAATPSCIAAAWAVCNARVRSKTCQEI